MNTKKAGKCGKENEVNLCGKMDEPLTNLN